MEDEKELLQQAAERLLSWYGSNRRAMPWREQPTPYRVWISEIMLQQTRIEAVVPYFLRFMRELPDVQSLAAVSDDKLMKLWEGLGYYSRARNLKKAAVRIMEDHGGVLPQSAEELAKLPGIGDYTAGAISSIAYGRAEPAVDGNVLRVVMRLFACGDDVARNKTAKDVAKKLRAVYPEGSEASALTQAWMEAGETVCLPNGAPKCGLCPLHDLCRSRAAGTCEQYPVKSPKKERKIQDKTVLLLCCDGKYALHKRGGGGLLAEMWEFPNFDGVLETDEIGARLKERGLDLFSVEPCGASEHIFTHIEWRMNWFCVQCGPQIAQYDWADGREIAEKYAVPAAFRYYKRLI